MATEHELEVLARYSTPGLQRNEFTREGKRMHLAMISRDAKENEKILNELYPDVHPVQLRPATPATTTHKGKGPTEE